MALLTIKIHYLDPKVGGIKTTSTFRNVAFHILDYLVDLEPTFLSPRYSALMYECNIHFSKTFQTIKT